MTGDGRADIDIAAFAARLRMLRAELAETSAQSADSRQPVELDQTAVGRISRMDAMRGQAMAVETERRRGLCQVNRL
jgi:DnaK suppressor protein